MNWFSKAETAVKTDAELTWDDVDAAYHRGLTAARTEVGSLVSHNQGAISEVEQTLANVKTTGQAHVAAIVAAVEAKGKTMVAAAATAATAAATAEVAKLVADATAKAQAAVAQASATVTAPAATPAA